MGKILCFSDYYVPGVHAGGPIRTLENMSNLLSCEFEFYVVTRDRDINAIAPYSDIVTDQWNDVGTAKVFYTKPGVSFFQLIIRLFNEIKPDIIYLNSFFSVFMTILPLIARRFGKLGDAPVVLAPRGEHSSGALSLKREKKMLYLFLVRYLNIYDDLLWHASSAKEASDIAKVISGRHKTNQIIVANNIIVAIDLTADYKVPAAFVNTRNPNRRLRKSGPLRIIFLSRIARMKNLDYLLVALGKVNNPVSLSIYGPVEDVDYWISCQNLINNFASHISVIYQGPVDNSHALEMFYAHDLFVFPTRGENFGHVIYEALSVGTAVIVSDQTPWTTDPDGSVEVLSLSQPDDWTAAINRWTLFDDQVYAARRTAAVCFAEQHRLSSGAEEDNLNLFRRALKS